MEGASTSASAPSSFEKQVNSITFSNATFHEANTWANTTHKMLVDTFARYNSSYKDTKKAKIRERVDSLRTKTERVKTLTQLRDVSTGNKEQSTASSSKKAEDEEEGLTVRGFVKQTGGAFAAAFAPEEIPVQEIIDALQGLAELTAEPRSKLTEKLSKKWRRFRNRSSLSTTSQVNDAPLVTRGTYEKQIPDHLAEIFETVQSKIAKDPEVCEAVDQVFKEQREFAESTERWGRQQEGV